jgi:uncharacterized iron-regulated membrane protein
MVAAALAAYPGNAVKFTDPASPCASLEITVSTAAQGKLAVYVNPYTGQVLGSLPDRGTIMFCGPLFGAVRQRLHACSAARSHPSRGRCLGSRTVRRRIVNA